MGERGRGVNLENLPPGAWNTRLRRREKNPHPLRPVPHQENRYAELKRQAHDEHRAVGAAAADLHGTALRFEYRAGNLEIGRAAVPSSRTKQAIAFVDQAFAHV